MEAVSGSFGRMTAGEGSSTAQDTATGEHYRNRGQFELRADTCYLGLIKAPLQLPFQLIFRAVDILALNFISRGLESAKLSHYDAVAKNRDLAGTPISTLSKVSHIVKELAKSIINLVTLPIAFLGRTFLFALSLVAPFQARRGIERIEQMYYVTPVNKFAPSGILEDVGNMTAPWFQSVEANLHENRARSLPGTNYHEKSSRTQLKRLMTEIGKVETLFDAPRDLNPWSILRSLTRMTRDLSEREGQISSALATIATPEDEARMWHTMGEETMNRRIVVNAARLSGLANLIKESAEIYACGQTSPGGQTSPERTLSIVAQEVREIIDALYADLRLSSFSNSQLVRGWY